MAYNDYEAVIGLEIHTQLFTKTKIFSPVVTQYGAPDNANTSPICLGMPGTLPRINEKVIEFSIKTGLALNCEIKRHSVFARKQYFYPDLSKGYQISQAEEPICVNGWVEFSVGGVKKRVQIERAHMEEDAGKSIHHGDHTLINYNRAGVPLLEIVSAPDMRSPAEAAEYARTIRNIVRYLGVCDGNLEQGSMRCDCNVSVRKRGDSKLGVKVELKNINSFRFIEKAIEYEIQRQVDCAESGQTIYQETRLYDSTKNMTFSMRSKEDAHDYRYFPDPDLLPIEISESWIREVRETLPELPLQKSLRFVQKLGLSENDADILTQDQDLAHYFETVQQLSGEPKLSANWILGELLRFLNEEKRQVLESPVSAQMLAQLISMIEAGEISGKIGKSLFVEMWKTGSDPALLVKEKGLSQISDDDALLKFIEQIMSENPENVQGYRNGKIKLFGFFVGQVMKLSKGQANPEAVNRLLKEKLESN